MSPKIYKTLLATIPLYLLPLTTFAFPTNLQGVVSKFTEMGLVIIPFLGAIAFLVFVLGVGKFIRSAGSEKDLKESKNLLIWGVIGLFVLVTIWGIIAFLQGEFGFGSTPGIPQIDPTKIK